MFFLIQSIITRTGNLYIFKTRKDKSKSNEETQFELSYKCFNLHRIWNVYLFIRCYVKTMYNVTIFIEESCVNINAANYVPLHIFILIQVLILLNIL